MISNLTNIQDIYDSILGDLYSKGLWRVILTRQPTIISNKIRLKRMNKKLEKLIDKEAKLIPKLNDENLSDLGSPELEKWQREFTSIISTFKSLNPTGLIEDGLLNDISPKLVKSIHKMANNLVDLTELLEQKVSKYESAHNKAMSKECQFHSLKSFSDVWNNESDDEMSIMLSEMEPY